MDTVVRYTSNGFPAAISKDAVSGFDDFCESASSKLKSLIEDYQDPRVNTEAWEWVSNALATVTDILHAAPSVLHEGLNPVADVGQRVPDFLLDTWKFIGTGRQVMEPRNWRDLMHVEGIKRGYAVSKHDQDAAKVLVRKDLLGNVPKLLSCWINQSNYPAGHGALSHVIQTLYVIYGK